MVMIEEDQWNSLLQEKPALLPVFKPLLSTTLPLRMINGGQLSGRSKNIHRRYYCNSSIAMLRNISYVIMSFASLRHYISSECIDIKEYPDE